MSFGLNNFTPSEGNYVSKILLPGTHTCRIIDLRLEKTPYDAEQYNLIFVLEGPDLGEDFKGVDINKLDPSKGTYKGQIASVRASQYAFKDWEYKGKTIKRDDSIQSFLGVFLTQVGLLNKFQELGIEADTIDELVTNVKAFIAKPSLTFAFTIGAQRYYKDGSEYPNYSLFLPKKSEGKYAYAKDETDPKLIEFNESVHVYEKKAPEVTEEVTSFAPAASNVFAASAPVFQDNLNDLQLP
jgi:hypothetical protein